jgi:hypothetical protein
MRSGEMIGMALILYGLGTQVIADYELYMFK